MRLAFLVCFQYVGYTFTQVVPMFFILAGPADGPQQYKKTTGENKNMD